MAIPYLTLIIRITRALLILFLVGAAILALKLVGDMVEVARTPEVRLQLNTRTPNLFGAWYDMQAGAEDGWKEQPRADRGPLPTLSTAVPYALASDPQAPLLRYREPSVWKRVALLVLGALNDSLSVASLVFLACGSWLLLKMLRDATPAVPFAAANARRLAWLALLIALLNLWDYVAYALVRGLVPAYRAVGLAAPLSHYVRLNTDELVPGYVVVLILLLIAAAYRRGVELSREAELVI